MLYRLTAYLVKLGTSILCRIHPSELRKIPMHGPLIVYSNHTGQIEVAVFFGQMQPRPITGWAKAESWESPFFRWLFTLWGIIPVRRGEGDTSALRRGVAALRDGFIFGIAPEGTRNVTGRLKRALPGAVMLALHAGVPLQPVAHWGGEDFRENLRHLKRTDFYIRVGDPFCLDVEGVRITKEIRQQIVDEMMYRLADLLPQQYRGEYEGVPNFERKYTKDCSVVL